MEKNIYGHNPLYELVKELIPLKNRLKQRMDKDQLGGNEWK